MKTWRERHPFLYGMTQVFGIAPTRREPRTPFEQMDRVERALRKAIEEEKRSDTPTD